jgi:hypothetical protein
LLALQLNKAQANQDAWVSVLTLTIGFDLATIMAKRGHNRINRPILKGNLHVRSVLNPVLLTKLLKRHSHISIFLPVVVTFVSVDTGTALESSVPMDNVSPLTAHRFYSPRSL